MSPVLELARVIQSAIEGAQVMGKSKTLAKLVEAMRELEKDIGG